MSNAGITDNKPIKYLSMCFSLAEVTVVARFNPPLKIFWHIEETLVINHAADTQKKIFH